MKVSGEVKAAVIGLVLLCTIAGANGFRRSGGNAALAAETRLASSPVRAQPTTADIINATNAAMACIDRSQIGEIKTETWMPSVERDEKIVKGPAAAMLVGDKAYFRFRFDKFEPVGYDGPKPAISSRGWRLILQKNPEGLWLPIGLDNH